MPRPWRGRLQPTRRTRISPVSAQRLHVRLRPAAEGEIRSGHPWVFDESIRELNRAGQSGELAVIFDRKNRFLALGLFDPDSPIRIRILHRGEPVMLDADWWRARLRAALARRTELFDAETSGYRLIHGENDGWPGLVLDRYGDTLVLKLYSGIWKPRLAEVVKLIAEELAPRRVVLRLSRNLAGSEPSDGRVLAGEPLTAPVQFAESGLVFEADVLRGQKTGFFLDQRDNRREIEKLSAGREVLNACSFSGGFSLYAARGGARAVTDLDLSTHALASSVRNFALNPHPNIDACRHTTVQADAFEWLPAQPGARFDLVIVDPPSLARRQTERAGALRAYERINAAALRLLRPGGLLLASSCSAHVPAADFYAAVLRAAGASGCQFSELKRTAHPPDHPATFPEAHYLKSIYLRITGTGSLR